MLARIVSLRVDLTEGFFVRVHLESLLVTIRGLGTQSCAECQLSEKRGTKNADKKGNARKKRPENSRDWNFNTSKPGNWAR